MQGFVAAADAALVKFEADRAAKAAAKKEAEKARIAAAEAEAKAKAKEQREQGKMQRKRQGEDAQRQADTLDTEIVNYQTMMTDLAAKMSTAKSQKDFMSLDSAMQELQKKIDANTKTRDNARALLKKLAAENEAEAVLAAADAAAERAAADAEW